MDQQKTTHTRTPIVFIHYGDTPYLKYTLALAKKQNPDKTVFLLGDEKNKKYERQLGIRHIPFVKYERSREIQEFSKNFIYIGGANRQRPQDKRFEFFCHVRWFYLHEFMKEMSYQMCWYFDSDTLILSPLSGEEKKFDAYDITEQSNGSNMKGIIRLEQIANFTTTINMLFADGQYVHEQRKDIEKNPDYALSDMRAYMAFKKLYRPTTIMLNTVLENEAHDECICEDDGMEMEYSNRLKRKIKKLYFRDGEVYEKDGATGALIKLRTINMSWVTTSLIEKVYYYRMYGKFPPFYVSLLGKVQRIPKFIKTLVTKETK